METWIVLILFALRANAQTSTTLSMFLNLDDSLPTPIITASIVQAGPMATTYVANCDYSDTDTACYMVDQTVTTGPSWQAFTSTGNDGLYWMSCTFRDTTSGACEFGQSAEGGSYTDTLDFSDPEYPFPGFMPVLVTAGVEKLAATNSATTSSVATEQVPSQTNTEPTTSSTSNAATNGANKDLSYRLWHLVPMSIFFPILYI